MEKMTKKELKEQYKNRKVTGGIYCIACSGNNKIWIKSTKNLEGQKNRYNFFFSTKTCPEAAMFPEWNQYGADSFSFKVLEELEKGETQTDSEFTEDIEVLYQMWLEKQQRE